MNHFWAFFSASAFPSGSRDSSAPRPSPSSPAWLADYYYDQVTGLSSWDPPALLRSWDLDKVGYTTDSPPRLLWCCKNNLWR